jgi:quercetin dioxygenase-like cupin family protein
MDKRLFAVDADALSWEQRTIEKSGQSVYRKTLMEDAETGMAIRLVRYPAGVINPMHTHPCAHGMYVLEGTLVTNEGTYGPGSFVWFPEGMEMSHGATSENDVTMLFITNKPMAIDYLA